MPFTGGFLAKFYVIGAAVQAGFDGLAVVAMLAAVVFAVPRPAGHRHDVLRRSRGGGCRQRGAGGVRRPGGANPRRRLSVALGLALVGTLLLGIVPGPATRVAEDATAELVLPAGGPEGP